MPMRRGALHPLDMAWCPGTPGPYDIPVLFVTRSSSLPGRWASRWACRITVFCASSGNILKEIDLPDVIKLASMLAVG